MIAVDDKATLEVGRTGGVQRHSLTLTPTRTHATMEQSRCSYLYASAKPKGKRERSIREGGESRKVGDTDEKYSCKIQHEFLGLFGQGLFIWLEYPSPRCL